VVLHTDEGKENVYKEWKFPQTDDWNDFWFNEEKTQILYYSVEHIIGKQSLDIARIRLTPQKEKFI